MTNRYFIIPIPFANPNIWDIVVEDEPTTVKDLQETSRIVKLYKGDTATHPMLEGIKEYTNEEIRLHLQVNEPNWREPENKEAFKYISVDAKSLTSRVRAEKISKELKKIEDPLLTESNEFLLPMGDNDSATVLAFTDETMLLVNDAFDVSELKAVLEDDLTEAEKINLEGFLDSQKGNKIPFHYLVPSGMNVYTNEEIKAQGFFKKKI
jgi:hypothetical protein